MNLYEGSGERASLSADNQVIRQKIKAKSRRVNVLRDFFFHGYIRGKAVIYSTEKNLYIETSRQMNISDKDQQFEKKKCVKLIVTEQHRSEYPHPITFDKGTVLDIGEKYSGCEGWNDWYLCSIPHQEPGWVPRQLIEWTDNKTGISKEAYSAKELDVNQGELLWGSKELNGWIWCARLSQTEEGWVPLKNIQKIV